MILRLYFLRNPRVNGSFNRTLRGELLTNRLDFWGLKNRMDECLGRVIMLLRNAGKNPCDI